MSKGPEIIIKKKGSDLSIFENLDLLDISRKIAPVLCKAVEESFGMSSVIILAPPQVSQYDMDQRTELAWDTFKIMYKELGWTLSRCLDQFPRIFKRRVTDRNWDFLAEEGSGMWAAPEEDQIIKEEDTCNTEIS